MTNRTVPADLAARAVQKLDPLTGERQSVTAFIQSCYCGRVQHYDLGTALAALSKLTEDEQHALIACALIRHELCRA